MAREYETFDLGNFTLQGGATLLDAKLAYATYGTLNDDRSMGYCGDFGLRN